MGTAVESPIRVVRRFNDPVYRRRYFVLTGQDLDGLCDWLRRNRFGIYDADSMLYSVGQTFSERFRVALWYDFTPTPEMGQIERVGVVGHESLHAAYGLFRRLNATVGLGPGVEEPMAYMMEWVIRQHVDLVMDGAELDPNAKKRRRR